MSRADYVFTIGVLVVLGLSGVATSLWRISRGGLQAVGAIVSLVATAGVLIAVIYVVFQFQNVSNIIGTGGSDPFAAPQYTPIPWSTVPIYSPYSTPTQGPGPLTP